MFTKTWAAIHEAGRFGLPLLALSCAGEGVPERLGQHAKELRAGETDNSYTGSASRADAGGHVDQSGGTHSACADAIVSFVDAGDFQCVVTRSGGVSCGQWNRDTEDSTATLVRISGLRDVTELSAMGSRVCAVHVTGAVSCWTGGWTTSDGGTLRFSLDNPPLPVPGLTDAVQVSVGWNHSCALRRSRHVVCWGENASGQLGDGTSEARAEPVVVSGLPRGISEVEAGADVTCAAHASGRVYCWGDNTYQQLGRFHEDYEDNPDGYPAMSAVPLEVPNLAGVRRLNASERGFCALLGRQVVCWGHASYEGGFTRISVPGGIAEVSGEYPELCLRHKRGSVSCFVYAQAGSDLEIVPVEGLTDAVQIDGRCALRRGSEVACMNSWRVERAFRPDLACLTGESCEGGECVCSTPTVRCAAGCADLMSDRQNCGSCEKSCGFGMHCEQGACTCPEGQTLCGYECVELSDSEVHCGACGNRCTYPEQCSNGQCGCTAPSGMCGTQCVDLANDGTNCGACGNACGGRLCADGRCHCRGGTIECDGQCVLFRGNPQHCYGCNIVCAPDERCGVGGCYKQFPNEVGQTVVP
jgi:hypothetical protein